MQGRKKKKRTARKYIKIRILLSIEGGGKEKGKINSKKNTRLSSPLYSTLISSDSQRSYPFSRDSAIPDWIKPEIIPQPLSFDLLPGRGGYSTPTTRRASRLYTHIYTRFPRRRDGRSLDRCPLSQHLSLPSLPLPVHRPVRIVQKTGPESLRGSRFTEEGKTLGCFVSFRVFVAPVCKRGGGGRGANVGPTLEKWRSVVARLSHPARKNESIFLESFLEIVSKIFSF